MGQQALFDRRDFPRTNLPDAPNIKAVLTSKQWQNLMLTLKHLQQPGRYRLSLNGLARKLRDRTGNYNERLRYGSPLWTESWLPHIDAIAEACKSLNIPLRNS